MREQPQTDGFQFRGLNARQPMASPLPLKNERDFGMSRRQFSHMKATPHLRRHGSG
jgi:hypothetical protein